MKKQELTKKDIQRALLSVLSKRKQVAVWLTLFLCVSLFLYVAYAVLYINGNQLIPKSLTFIGPAAVMIIAPIILLFLAVFLIFYYYLHLFEIKSRSFNIIEEALCQKEAENKNYYRRQEKEYALYFRCGRVAVDAKAYSCSNIGDQFYLVKTRASKAPLLAYNTNNYYINDTEWAVM